MGATRKRPKKGAAQEEAEWSVLFPFIDVELQGGKKVTVRQWDIETGAVLTPRVVRLMDKLREAGLSGEVELDDLLTVAVVECKALVAGTIGWTVAELGKRASYLDFLSLLQAVIDTSLVRPDGEGALKKIVDLAGALGPLAGLRPPERSTSSSAPATPSPISGE